MAGATVPEIYCGELKIEDLTVYLASTRKGAFRIGLTLERQCDCMEFFDKLFPESRLFKDDHANSPLKQAVEDALMDRRPGKTAYIDLTFTPFQWKAMQAISRIPFGETRTYGEVAALTGNPKSARAIGQAMGRNPLPLIFP